MPFHFSAAAAAAVYAELVAAAEQLEAKEFEQCGAPLGALSRGALEETAPSGDDPDPLPYEPLPMRVLLPHHILDAAKAVQPL